jgi:hypothetical protein
MGLELLEQCHRASYPIDQAIKMSESDRSSSWHVVTGWKRVRRAMKTKLAEMVHQHLDTAGCEERVLEKNIQKRQVTEIYYVARLSKSKDVTGGSFSTAWLKPCRGHERI